MLVFVKIGRGRRHDEHAGVGALVAGPPFHGIVAVEARHSDDLALRSAAPIREDARLGRAEARDFIAQDGLEERHARPVAASEALPIEPVWRLTKNLDVEIGVASQITDLTGKELAEILTSVDAVICSSSTAILEAMLLGLPTALLDYSNVPHYLQTAWQITASSQIARVVGELVNPPLSKMLHQETMLHDSLECGSPATPRLARLAAEMIQVGREAKRQGTAPVFPQILPAATNAPAAAENRFSLSKLYPEHSSFQISNLTELQAELGHLRLKARELEKQIQGEAWQPDPNETARAFRFVSNVNTARRLKGNADQVAVWNVEIRGVSSQALFLHPPGQLVFEIPTGARGRFSAAVTMHPDVWRNTASGACEFQVLADKRTMTAVVINPIQNESERCWHEIVLDIPFNSAGKHEITLTTQAVGTNSYRWALWRDPRFTWQETIPAKTPLQTATPPPLTTATA